MEFWLWQVTLALDQLANALRGGWADESLSSAAYRQRAKGRPWISRTINLLFFWQQDHCYSAYLSEKEQKQTHPEVRTKPAPCRD